MNYIKFDESLFNEVLQEASCIIDQNEHLSSIIWPQKFYISPLARIKVIIQ